MKYRNKKDSTVVDVIQWKNDYAPFIFSRNKEFQEFLPADEKLDLEKRKFYRHFGEDSASLKVGNNRKIVEINDWIIKKPDGEYDSCKSDVFKKTYEKVEEEEE